MYCTVTVFGRLLMGLPVQIVNLLSEVWRFDIANRVGYSVISRGQSNLMKIIMIRHSATNSEYRNNLCNINDYNSVSFRKFLFLFCSYDGPRRFSSWHPAKIDKMRSFIDRWAKFGGFEKNAPIKQSL